MRKRRLDDGGELEETVANDELLEHLDEALLVREALEQLSPECQEILDRLFARDESYRTISDALDLPGGTVASRISRCLRRLRDELEASSDGTGRNLIEPSSGGYEHEES